MANELYIPQIDYTSRDYAALRSDLVNLIDKFAPQWTSRDSSDFGIVLLELFAYAADVLNYYVDRAANESFISTATQRDTVLEIARILNYTPNDVVASTGTVTFTNTTAAAITVYAGTQLSASGTSGDRVLFEVDANTVVPAKVGSVNGTVTATVTQGYAVTSEPVGVSDGSLDQAFKLGSTNVMTGMAVVNGTKTYTITATVGATPYTKVASLMDAKSTDNVFTTKTDGDGFTYLVFGDGIHGTVPPTGSVIYATYKVGLGATGNVSANSINTIYRVFQGTTPNVSVTNLFATSGGADAESTDSIRINAPKAMRAVSRAVSLEDFESIALQIPGVAKAKALATSPLSVVIYVAASGGGPMSTSLQNSVYTYFSGKTFPGVTIQVLDYTPVYPDIRVTLGSTDILYDATTLKAQVAAAIENLLTFDSVDFADVIYDADIKKVAESVQGVIAATVTGMSKKTTLTDTTVPTSGTSIFMHADELPIVNAPYIVVS